MGFSRRVGLPGPTRGRRGVPQNPGAGRLPGRQPAQPFRSGGDINRVIRTKGKVDGAFDLPVASAPSLRGKPVVESGTVDPPALDSLDPGWAQALAPVEAELAAMAEFLRDEAAAGRPYLPADEHILRAFARPFADVRVVVVGMDP